MDVKGNLEAVIMKPIKKLAVIGEKLCIPAVSRPALKKIVVKNLLLGLWLLASGLLAKAVNNVRPMPVHINGGNGDGKSLVNELLHKASVLLLSVGLVSRPPVAEGVLGNKGHLACKLKEVTELTEIVVSVGKVIFIGAGFSRKNCAILTNQ